MTEEELLFELYYRSLVFIRIIGLFLIVPIFGSKVVPKRVKLALAFFITIIVSPFIVTENIMIPEKMLVFAFEIIMELFIGLILGAIVLLTFITIQLAGQFMDRRMGLMRASMMDPQSGFRVPLIGQTKNILATLVFLIMNGHHYILTVLADSFRLVKINQFQSSPQLIEGLLRIIGNLFPLGFKIALPILTILFLVDLSFGLIARTVPQMNVFMMGMPTKILVGLVILISILPNFINVFEDLFANMFNDLYNILKLMQ